MIEAARERIREAIGAHQRFALDFGGGKDSHAVLYLLRPWWDRLCVLWANAGDPFPETVELMGRVAGLVGEFHEVKGYAKEAQARAYPVDLLPARASPMGRALEPEGAKVTLRNRFDCCLENMWLPMAAAKQRLGITLVFRGQRDSESLRSPLRDGAALPGAPEICLPIQDWTERQVFDYLEAEGVELPRSYAHCRTSLDCMMCTGYMEDARGRMEYLDRYHPEAAKEYMRRTELIADEQAIAYQEVRRTLQDIRRNRANV